MNPESEKTPLTTPSKISDEVLTTLCRMCGCEISYTDPEGVLARMGLKLKPNICNACNDKREQQALVERREKRVQVWREMCPSLYHESDMHHASMPPLELQERILDWKFGPKGLIVRGASGTCKTRLCWLLLRRLAVEGHSIKGLTCGQFAARLAASYRSDDPEAQRDFFESMTRCRVLFLDDLGKFKLTERVEQDLFEIVEERCSHQLPLIMTTNLVGKSLLKMMTPDRGEPLVRRLREFCEDVAL